MAVTGCVGLRRPAPALHCRTDTWGRSLTASEMGFSKSGFELPNVVRGTLGEGFGKGS